LADGFTLVVGGSGGLGAAVCRALAGDVVITYAHNLEAAQHVAAEIRAAGGGASVRQLLLPDGELGDLEGCHGVVFAAGTDIAQPYLSATDPSALREAVDIEVHGFFAVVKAALPSLRQNRGFVVALVSAGLSRWPPGDGLSVVPKAGIEALVRGLAREEGRHGVRANAVAVGVVDAGMFHRIGFDERWLEAARKNIPLRRFGTAEEIGHAVRFLSDATYVSGQTLYVDGGYTT
jgi:NAD(P)-dependent dehydrogenase (short-subunit alcohol dehydrogenase family)